MAWWVSPAARAASDALDQIDVVVGTIEGAWHAQVFVMSEALGQMLQQRAAVGHVDQLHATTDAEHGQFALDRGPHQRDLETIALGDGVERLWMRLRPVACRVDVRAAGHHETVEQVERFLGLCEQELVGRQHHDERPGALHSLDIAAREQNGLLVPHAPTSPLQCRAYADHRSAHLHTP